MKNFLKKPLALLIGLTVLTACGTGADSDPLALTQTFDNRSCQCSFQAPEDWTDDVEYFDNTVMAARSENHWQYFMVFSVTEEEANGLPLDEYANEVLKDLKGRADEFKQLSRKEITIDEIPAIQYRIDTTFKDQSTANIYTFLKNGGQYYQLLAWSDAKTYRESRSVLFAVRDSFRFRGSL